MSSFMDRPRIEQDILGAYGRLDTWFTWLGTEKRDLLGLLGRYPLLVKIPQAEMNGGTIGHLACNHIKDALFHSRIL